MDFSKENLRFYAWMRLQYGESPTVIYEQFQETLPIEKCPSYSTVSRWCADFKTGDRQTLSDAGRGGRPRSSTGDENVTRVEELLKTDRRLTIREMEDTLHLSRASVHRIVTSNLQMKKLCARWVPHILKSDDKIRRVECARALLEFLKNRRTLLSPGMKVGSCSTKEPTSDKT